MSKLLQDKAVHLRLALSRFPLVGLSVPHEHQHSMGRMGSSRSPKTYHQGTPGPASSVAYARTPGTLSNRIRNVLQAWLQAYLW